MRTNRRVGAAWGVGLAVLLVGGCAPGSAMDGAMARPAGTMQMDRASMAHMTSGWHPAAQEAMQSMTQKYGAPAEMTPTMAVWHDSGPWKRTIVYAQEVPHHFPMPHPDVLEQFIDYRMPPVMFDEIAMYDGSVILERTKGEMSARCDKEGANFLGVRSRGEVVR